MSVRDNSGRGREVHSFDDNTMTAACTSGGGRRSRSAERVAAGLCAAFLCALAAALPGLAQPVALETPASLTARLDALALRELQRSPQLAYRLGLPSQFVGFEPAAAVDDRSPAALSRARLDWIQALQTLDTLAPAQQAERDVALARFAYSHMAALAAFGYGEVGLDTARPYAIDHMNGQYIELLDLLVEVQPVRTPAEAEQWLARLAGMGPAIDAERRRLLFDAAQGVSAPPAVLERMRGFIAPLADVSVREHPVMVSLQRRLGAMPDLEPELRAQYLSRAARLLGEAVIPAYGRLRDAVDERLSAPNAGPGVWALPRGHDYYLEIVSFYTSTTLSPSEIYSLGQAQVRELEAELDVELRAIGLDKGSVGERLALLSARRDQLYPDTPEGREAVLSRLRAALVLGQARLGAVLPVPTRAPMAIEAVSEAFSATLPSAYYRSARLDGSQPATLYVNLSDMGDWPDFTLPTLVYHEGVPGHHADAAYPRPVQPGASMLSRLVWVPAYDEGWATYAEDLADEIGLYEGDPYARIGYLQSLLLRAARCVVDTGVHERRWSREAAIEYLVATTGLPAAMMADEVDRYLVWPGQAVTYLVGRDAIRTARARAERVLGERFELREFNDVILRGGPRPLWMVEDDIDAWQAARLSAGSAGAR